MNNLDEFRQKIIFDLAIQRKTGPKIAARYQSKCFKAKLELMGSEKYGKESLTSITLADFDILMEKINRSSERTFEKLRTSAQRNVNASDLKHHKSILKENNSLIDYLAFSQVVNDDWDRPIKETDLLNET